MTRSIEDLKALYSRIVVDLLHDNSELLHNMLNAVLTAQKDVAEESFSEVKRLIFDKLSKENVTTEEYKVIQELQTSTDWRTMIANVIKQKNGGN